MEIKEKNLNEEAEQNTEENMDVSTQTEDGEETPEDEGKGNTVMYSVRLIAAFYLVYVAYGIFKGFIDGNENITPFLLFMAVLFTVFAVCFGLSGYRGLQRGRKVKKKTEDKQEKGIFKQTAPQQKKSISERAHLVEQIEDEEE